MIVRAQAFVSCCIRATGCELCEEMLGELSALPAAHGVPVAVVDVDRELGTARTVRSQDSGVVLRRSNWCVTAGWTPKKWIRRSRSTVDRYNRWFAQSRLRRSRPPTKMKNIRNFSIIAHVDHGKSTLADRFIQECGGLDAREMQAQVLDSMDLERERGITIKAQSVTLGFTSKSGELYQLNFIDTPGHVDFSYEVSRSLAACEGALLVVDAAQGVEAQSVANCYTALEQGLEVLPVINKIDLPSADPAKVIHEIEEIIGIPADDAALVSAKTGLGVPELLEQLVQRIPAPQGDPQGPLQALIIDLVVRQLCRRRFAGAREERRAAHRRENPRDVDRAQPQHRQAGTLFAQARDSSVVGDGRGGLRHRRHQGDRRCAGGRHHHFREQPGQGNRWRVSNKSSRGCSQACFR